MKMDAVVKSRAGAKPRTLTPKKKKRKIRGGKKKAKAPSYSEQGD